MSDSDAALVARTLGGDLRAYAALMGRYRDKFGRYAFHMLGNREDAQEALQDSFVRAYRGLGACRQPERFGAWLFRILVNRCRTVRRRLQRDRRFDADLPDDVAVERRAARLLRMAGRDRPGARPAPSPLPRGVSAALRRRTGIRRDVGDDGREGTGAPDAGQARERPAPRAAARRPCRLSATIELDDELLQRVVAELRRPVQLDPAVDQRALDQIRAEAAGWQAARHGHRWGAWLAGAAIAAGLLLAVLSASANQPPASRWRPASPSRSPRGTPARSTSGSTRRPRRGWRSWATSTTGIPPRRRSARAGDAGTWVVELRLKPGRYHYTFLIDGRRWERDPSEPPAAEQRLRRAGLGAHGELSR